MLGLLHGNLLMGFCYGWWVSHHNKHHSHPNHLEKDSDITRRRVIFTPEQGHTREGRVKQFIVRHQHKLFYPLLTTEWLGLRVASLKAVREKACRGYRVEADADRRAPGRLLHHGLPVMSPGKAVAFILHEACCSASTSAGLRPEPQGHADPAPGEDWDWMTRQVLTSRNIRSSYLTDFLYGGLNYQIEHHLYPTMPRKSLRQARPITIEYCREIGIRYYEVSVSRSYVEVVHAPAAHVAGRPAHARRGHGVTRAGLDAARALPLEVQRARAEHFAALHGRLPCVLPSLRRRERRRRVPAGPAAVATTSGGQFLVARRPGRQAPAPGAGRRPRAGLPAVVDVPVTADVEDGYGDAPDELVETVRAVLAAGAVGINVEDSVSGLRSAQAQAARFRTVRAAADELGVPLFVNARTDVFLLGPDPGATDGDLLERVVSRAEAYAAAGADGLFVPGLLDLEALRELVLRVALPVGVMTGPGAPSVAALAAVGVRRVSAGTALAQSAYTHALRGGARAPHVRHLPHLGRRPRLRRPERAAQAARPPAARRQRGPRRAVRCGARRQQLPRRQLHADAGACSAAVAAVGGGEGRRGRSLRGGGRRGHDALLVDVVRGRDGGRADLRRGPAGAQPSAQSEKSAAVSAARSRRRMRARVGPMLPIGMSSRALICS